LSARDRIGGNLRNQGNVRRRAARKGADYSASAAIAAELQPCEAVGSAKSGAPELVISLDPIVTTADRAVR
jgi:hypothetical protein